MELLCITLASWVAFGAAAILSGFLVDQLVRGLGRAHA
jgi:hypothetical protein